MTLTDILQRIYDDLGYNQTTVAASETRRIKGYVNDHYRRIMANKHMAPLRRSLVTVASVAGSPYLVLPAAATQIYSVVDRTNQYTLSPTTMDDIRETDPSLNFTAANPWSYVSWAMASPVTKQPVDASRIFIKSSAAGDTTQTAYLEGLDATGALVQTSVVLTGTTAVGWTPTNITEITKLYLSAVAVGTLTITEDSGAGTTLSTIPIGAFSPGLYTILHLYPVPSAVVTYHVDIERRIADLSNPGDYPLIPEDWHNMLVNRVVAQELGPKREKLGIKQALDLDYARDLVEMHSHVNRTHNTTVGQRPRRFSQLGAWFENGS